MLTSLKIMSVRLIHVIEFNCSLLLFLLHSILLYKCTKFNYLLWMDTGVSSHVFYYFE